LVAAALCVYFLLVEPAFNNLGRSKRALEAERARLARLLEEGDAGHERSKRLAEFVPVFEQPQGADEQGRLLRDGMTELLKKSGVQVRSLAFVRGDLSGVSAGFDKVLLQCRGRCGYESVLNLLSQLKLNPYYAGIEELTLTADAKKRDELEMSLTVSTFARKGK
jgi:hypothetical protein